MCISPRQSRDRVDERWLNAFAHTSLKHDFGPSRALNRHRLSRHAIMYKCDLRTSSTAVLSRPMSASSRSSSSRSSLYWPRRSHLRAIPSSQASGIFQDHPRPGREGKAGSRMLVEMLVCHKTWFLLHNGAKQRLAAGAHRAVVNDPNVFVITPNSNDQGIGRRGHGDVSC